MLAEVLPAPETAAAPLAALDAWIADCEAQLARWRALRAQLAAGMSDTTAPENPAPAAGPWPPPHAFPAESAARDGWPGRKPNAPPADVPTLRRQALRLVLARPLRASELARELNVPRGVVLLVVRCPWFSRALGTKRYTLTEAGKQELGGKPCP